MEKKSKRNTKRPGKPAKRTTKAKVKKGKASPAKSKSKPKKSKSKPAPKPKSAPQTGPKRIGFLIAATPADWDNYIDAFTDRLKAKGWIIGNGTGPADVSIDFQPPNGAAGDLNIIRQWANTFVANTVDLIVTSGTQAADACKRATATIPIVFAAAGDPVGSGLVATPTAPEANITGCCNLQTQDATLKRRIAIMNNKLNPTKVAVIGNNNLVIYPVDVAMDSALAALNTAGIPAAPKGLGCFAPGDFATPAAIRAKLVGLGNQVDVLLVCSDPVLTSHATALVTEAHKLGMSTMHEMREGRDHHGGDQTFGPNFTNLFRQAAEMSDKILRNTPIRNIPVYTPKNTSNVQDPP